MVNRLLCEMCVQVLGESRNDDEALVETVLEGSSDYLSADSKCRTLRNIHKIY